MLAVIVIASMFLGAYNIVGVWANFEPGPLQVTIVSPKSYSNNINPVLLNISASMFLDPLKGSENRYITYSVDGQANVSMTPVYHGISTSGAYSYSSVTSQAILPNLSDSWHVIMVYVKYDYGTWVNEGSARVEFPVGRPTTLNPSAPILKVNIPTYPQVFPENQPIPYSVNITIPPSWFTNSLLRGEIYSVSYVLDNTGNIISIAGRDSAKGPYGPMVINGSAPACIPVYTANHPTIVLTGTIPAQSPGNHTLVFLILWSDYGDNIMTSNFQTRFSVSDKISQPINMPSQIPQTSGVFTVMSPENQVTYNTNQVPITYSVDSKVTWSYYALDTAGEPESSDWKSFNGNITLTRLSEGSHKLTISVKSEANTPSVPTFEQTINFNADSNAPIASNQTLTAPTPTLPELSWLVILPFILIIFSVVMLIRHHRYPSRNLLTKRSFSGTDCSRGRVILDLYPMQLVDVNARKSTRKIEQKNTLRSFNPLLFLMSLAFWTQTIVPAHASTAQPYKVVQITFPRSETYDSNLLTLNVTFPVGGLKYTLTYTLDGNDEGSIPWTVNNPNNELHVVYEAIGSVNMPELSAGPHQVVVTLQVDVHQNGSNPPNGAFKPVSPGSLDYQAIWTDTVDFTVEPKNTPDTQPLPTNANYTSNSIPQAPIPKEPNNSMPQPTINQVPLTKTSTSTTATIIRIFASTAAAALVVIIVSLFILKRNEHLKSRKFE